ncbi:MAG: CPBP family intramembrane glutamic endopeptidase [Patescibacteria group bacterium]
MKTSKKLSFIILNLFFLFIAPVFIVYYKIIPFEYHRYVLFVFTILIVILTIKERESLKNLGIYKGNLFKYYLPYTLFTIIGIIFIYVIAEFIGREPLDWDSQYLYVLLVIPLSFCQEFIYRGYLMSKLKSFFNSALVIILINTFLFTILHIIFKDFLVVIPLAFISGLAFAWLYYKYPNLLLISISHSILNFTAVLLYGFFK